MAKEEKLDWFPLYVYEFITDILGWTNQEVGAYFRLLCVQWINGELPGDLERLAKIAHEPITEFKLLWETIGKKFTIDNKRHFNLKLEKVRKQQQKLIDKKSDAGSEGAKVRWEKEKQKRENATQFPFAGFWDLYEKKVGEKEKLAKKWDKLSEEERAKALNYIPKYKLAQPDKKYRKNPETFLNNKSWNDELIVASAPGKSTPGQTPYKKKQETEEDIIEKNKTLARYEYLKANPPVSSPGENGLGSLVKKKMEQLAPKTEKPNG